jgi:hypothetical protein
MTGCMNNKLIRMRQEVTMTLSEVPVWQFVCLNWGKTGKKEKNLSGKLEYETQELQNTNDCSL